MSIPFVIPGRLMLRFFAGDIVRSGTLLREASTGRIVAHLQEAKGLARMAARGFDPLKLAAEGVQIYQNEQIKAGLELVKNLGIANLALTGLGIGVSVVGFAVLKTKLDRIETRIDDLAVAIERVSRKLDGVRDYLLRQELADLRAELRRIDEAWMEPDTKVQTAQWRESSGRLLTIEERFHAHARALVAAGEEPRLRDLMIDAYVLAANGRQSALLASASGEAAEQAARDFHKGLVGLTEPLGTAELLREMMTAEGAAALSERAAAVERLHPQARARATLLREREDLAATAPLTIAALRRANLPGLDWLQRARTETDLPLICLPVDEPVNVAA